MNDWQKALNRLEHPDTKEVIKDVETDGLDWRTNKIVGYVLTFGPRSEDNYYLPIAHGAGGNIPDGARVTKGIMDIAGKRRDLHWIGHNFQFDLMFLWKHGINVVGTVEDTMVNAALINEFMRSFSLEACCKYMGTEEKKGEGLYKYLADTFGQVNEKQPNKNMANFWKLAGDDPVAVDYAIGDGIATWHLRAAQVKRIAEEELTNVYMLERRVTRVLHRMTRRGIRVDMERLAKIDAITNSRLSAARNGFPEDFNERSSASVAKLLHDHDIRDYPRNPPTKTNKEGSPNLNEAWLKTFPLGQRVIAVRKYSNLLNSFITPLKERHVFGDRVHCSFNQLKGDDFGTVTGRLSANAPNLQQVPKRNKELGVLFRSVFIPEMGHVWASDDYVQCEPCLLAHYSNCRVLVDGYLSDPPIDAHSAVAKEAGVERQVGKVINQTLITGGGARKVADELNVSEAEAKEFMNKYFRSMPEIRKIQGEATRVMESRGYVKSLLGRRARLDDPRFAYRAVNRLLQCGNADILKKAMADVDEYFESQGDQCSLMNNVHDALDSSFPEDCRNQYDHAVSLMTDYGPEGKSTWLRVPLRIDHGEGPNWALATWPEEEQTL